MAASATWASVDGSAVSGQDFGVSGNPAPRTGMVSWMAGDATPKSFVIPIINDTLGGEGDQDFTVVLTPGPGLVLASSGSAEGIGSFRAPGTATVTIHDNDIAPQSEVRFSAVKYPVVEGTPSIVLTANRNDRGGGFGLAASVSYSMLAGTALATSDYIASSGVLSWPPGVGGPRTITVPIVNNALAEPPESFRVRLTNNSPGLGIATPEAAVLILDDDELFPIDGVVSYGWTKPVTVDAGWHASNDPGAYEGVFALRSDMIDDGQQAAIELQGTFEAGTVAFRLKISSEANFDVLRFYVDGVAVGSWSGTAVAGWQMFSTPLAAGFRALRWSYEKDGNVSAGSDAAWIDAVTTPSYVLPP